METSLGLERMRMSTVSIIDGSLVVLSQDGEGFS